MIETDFNEAQWSVCQPRPGDWTDAITSDSSLILISWAETVLLDTLTCSPRHYQSSQWADVLRVAWSFPSQNIDTVSVRPRLMREIPWQSFLVMNKWMFIISFCWVSAEHVIMFISRQGTQKHHRIFNHKTENVNVNWTACRIFSFELTFCVSSPCIILEMNTTHFYQCKHCKQAK